MPGYTKTDALIAQIKRHKERIKCEDELLGFVYKVAHDDIIEIIKDESTTDVEEVRHGEWVRDADLIDGDVWVRWSCSKCGYARTRGWEDTEAGTKPQAKLCENCGARMDEEEDENAEEVH